METNGFVSEVLDAQRTAVIAEELEQTRQRIRRFAEQELASRRERLERAETVETQELDLRRKYDQDRRAIREQGTREASKKTRLNGGDYKRSIEGSPPTQADAPKSQASPEPPQGTILEMKVQPILAFKDHPYRLYFNWPALREDRVTGEAE